MARFGSQTRVSAGSPCSDHVIGDILSGWRYDISGISPDLRGDYEAHLRECNFCHRRQRLHRTIDLLLLAATTLSFSAFLMAALVMHRLEAISHISTLHVRLGALHSGALTHIPASITISLEAIAIVGVFVSLLLWLLVALVTPIPGLISSAVRERVSPEARDRLRKQAA